MMQSQQPITIEDIYALFRTSQEELQRSPHCRTRTSRRDLPTQTAITPSPHKTPDRLFPDQTASAPSSPNTRSPISSNQIAMSHQKTKSSCRI